MNGAKPESTSISGRGDIKPLRDYKRELETATATAGHEGYGETSSDHGNAASG
jgi:hypothetical protein